MEHSNRPWYAKILLFGEYTLLLDSMGLSIPFPGFSGQWVFMRQTTKGKAALALRSNLTIREYSRWVRSAEFQGDIREILELERLEQDLNDGIFFDSSIPVGYGIGSSGALIGALYDRYARQKIVAQDQDFDTNQLRELKQLFSKMEAFFHGKSSGLDPLSAYTARPLMILRREEIQVIGPPLDVTSLLPSVFLIDTGCAGQTRPMVERFVHSCKDQEYFERIREELIPINNLCVKEFLSANQISFLDHLAKLSHFQFTHFHEMIPQGMFKAWKRGLDTGSYHLKLCGSGGGGFLLGFSTDEERARMELKALGIRPAMIYQPV